MASAPFRRVTIGLAQVVRRFLYLELHDPAPDTPRRISARATRRLGPIWRCTRRYRSTWMSRGWPLRRCGLTSDGPDEEDRDPTATTLEANAMALRAWGRSPCAATAGRPCRRSRRSLPRPRGLRHRRARTADERYAWRRTRPHSEGTAQPLRIDDGTPSMRTIPTRNLTMMDGRIARPSICSSPPTRPLRAHAVDLDTGAHLCRGDGAASRANRTMRVTRAPRGRGHASRTVPPRTDRDGATSGFRHRARPGRRDSSGAHSNQILVDLSRRRVGRASDASAQPDRGRSEQMATAIRAELVGPRRSSSRAAEPPTASTRGPDGQHDRVDDLAPSGLNGWNAIRALRTDCRRRGVRHRERCSSARSARREAASDDSPDTGEHARLHDLEGPV